jgi:hypothetical protein
MARSRGLGDVYKRQDLDSRVGPATIPGNGWSREEIGKILPGDVDGMRIPCV